VDCAKRLLRALVQDTRGQFFALSQPYDGLDDFAEQVERCLREWLAKRGVVTREIWDRARFGSPFPGLAAFDAKREHVFFGRDLAIRQATERLREAKTPFLLILGSSGSANRRCCALASCRS
jgi:hypothetical protein